MSFCSLCLLKTLHLSVAVSQNSLRERDADARQTVSLWRQSDSPPRRVLEAETSRLKSLALGRSGHQVSLNFIAILSKEEEKKEEMEEQRRRRRRETLSRGIHSGRQSGRAGLAMRINLVSWICLVSEKAQMLSSLSSSSLHPTGDILANGFHLLRHRLLLLKPHSPQPLSPLAPRPPMLLLQHDSSSSNNSVRCMDT